MSIKCSLGVHRNILIYLTKIDIHICTPTYSHQGPQVYCFLRACGQKLNTMDSCFKWYLAERLSSTLRDIGLSHERLYESLYGTSSLHHLTNRYFLPCHLYSLAKKVKTAYQTKPTRKPVQNACCKYFKRFQCEESRAVFLGLTQYAFLKIHPSFLQATINTSPTHLRINFIQTFPRPT